MKNLIAQDMGRWWSIAPFSGSQEDWNECEDEELVDLGLGGSHVRVMKVKPGMRLRVGISPNGETYQEF